MSMRNRICGILLNNEIKAACLIHVVIFTIIMLAGATPIYDFRGYFDAASLIRSGKIIEIYDFESSVILYRYFPTFATMLVPLLPLGPYAAFYIMSILSLISSILAASEARKIALLCGKQVKGMTLLILASSFAASQYVFGNNVTIAVYFIMLSFRLMVEEKMKFAALALGFSIMIKPIAIFIVFSVFVAYLVRKDFKDAVKFGLFLLVPLVPDVLFFALTPGLAQAFVNGTVGLNLYGLDSISATAFPHYYIGLAFGPLLITGLILSTIPMIKLRNDDHNQAFFVYSFGIVLHFALMLDVWYSQFSALLPCLLLSFMLIKKVKISTLFKYWLGFQFLTFLAIGAWLFTPILMVLQGFFMCFWICVIHWLYKAFHEEKLWIVVSEGK